MSKFSGIGDRLKHRLKLIGYWKNGRPDVARFCHEKGYRPQYLYAWLKNRLPGPENLDNLSRDLEVSGAWILFGEQTAEVVQEAGVTEVAVAPGRPHAAGLAPGPGRSAGPAVGRTRAPASPHDGEGGAGPAGSPAPGNDANRLPSNVHPVDFKRLREVTEKLVLLEGQLGAVLQAFPDLYVWLDTDGTILDSTAGPGSDFPLPADRLPGGSLETVLPAEAGRALQAVLLQAVRAGTLTACEFSLPVGDGPRAYEARFIPLQDRPLRHRKVLLNVRNITERKRAEESLRESQERQALILRSVPVAVYTAHAPGDLARAWIGENVERLSGIPRECFAEDPTAWAARIHPEDRERVLQSLEGVPVDGTFVAEYRWRHADGSYRWFLDQATSVRREDGAPKEVVGTWVDITQRKRAEEGTKALVEVGRLLTEMVDLDRVLGLVVEKAAELLQAPASAVFLVERFNGGMTLEFRQSRGLTPSHGQGFTLADGEGIIGKAIHERRPIWTADILNDPDIWLSEETRQRDLLHGIPRALLAAPLMRGEAAIGALVVLRSTGSTYEPREVQFLAALASQAAVAIENARLFRQEKERRRQLEAVRAVTAEITRELDLPSVLGLINRRAIELLRAEAGEVFLWDECEQLLVPKAWQGYGDWVGDLRLGPDQGLTGTVARRRKGLIVNDYRRWPHAHPVFLDGAPVTAALGEPLLYGDRLLGVITLSANQGRTFTEEDLQTLALFAAEAAIAIENARLFQDERRRARQLEAVRAVTAEITRELHLPTLLDRIYRGAADLVGVGTGTLYLWDEAAQRLVPQVWYGYGQGEWIVALRLPPGRGVVGAVAQRRLGMIVNDYRLSPLALPMLLERTRAVAVMAEPMLYRDHFIGVIVLDRMEGEGPFTEPDRELLALFAAQAAIAIENARLFREALWPASSRPPWASPARPWHPCACWRMGGWSGKPSPAPWGRRPRNTGRPNGSWPSGAC